MNFILGLGLGAIVTMGIAFIVSPKQADIDEDEENWYT
jgi:hypothetical protein